MCDFFFVQWQSPCLFEPLDFTFICLKQHHSQWAGQLLCASAQMSKKKVPWRKTLGHRTLPTQRLVPTFNPEQKKLQMLHKTTRNHCFQFIWCLWLGWSWFPFPHSLLPAFAAFCRTPWSSSWSCVLTICGSQRGTSSSLTSTNLWSLSLRRGAILR